MIACLALREAWPIRKIKMRRMKTIIKYKEEKIDGLVLEWLLEGDKPSAKIRKISKLKSHNKKLWLF